MCVTMGPPIRGDPISHSQAHSFVNVVNCGKGEGKHVLAQCARNFFFPRYGVAHGCAQEPTPGSAVNFRGKSVRKNQPLVPRSNIAGSWTGGGSTMALPPPPPLQSPPPCKVPPPPPRDTVTSMFF